VAHAPDEPLDLIYSRFNHPNAEIFEGQIVPLEEGSEAALVFNSGMPVSMAVFLARAAPEFRVSVIS
jgi:methionine-gamma-lyase